MKKIIKHILVITAFFAIKSTVQAQSQTFVNIDWVISNGNPSNYDYVSSTIDPNGNLVYISNHSNGSNTDILLSCIHPNGTIAWQNNCGSSPTADDYGADLKIDNSGNIFICAAKHNGNNLDYLVAKYSSTGSLIWQQAYNGTGNGDDVPSAITLDASGNVFVTGTSKGTGSPFNTDYATIKYNSSGTQQWVKRYNFANLTEIATGVSIDNSGNVIVCGTSANNLSNADFTIVKYNNASGVQMGVQRHATAGNGYDLPTEMKIDGNGKIFVVGTSEAGTNKDIKVLALNNNLTVNWVKYIDKCGNTDEGHGLALKGNSEVVATGFSTKTSGGTDFVTCNLSNVSGTENWSNNKPALIDSDISKGRKVTVGSNGTIYVTGETQIGNSRVFSIIAFRPDGSIKWGKEIDGLNGTNYSPRQITEDNGIIYVTGIKEDGNTNEITTVRLSEREKPFNPAYVNGIASHNKGELIIRFDTSMINYAAINKKEFEAGILSDFVKPSAIQQMENKYNYDWKNARTFKIFRNMTTADTISVTRLGDTIRIDDFWATLSVFFPENYTEQQVADSLSIIADSIIHYAHLNGIIERHNIPNDPLVSIEQAGLIPTTSFSNAHISIEDAWNIEVGQSHTKVGVFDDPIYWAHEDFGDGTYNGSKIEGGWDYYNNVHISGVISPGSSHGTSVAGIIGALRNNNIGIAGIAGGDVDGASNTGVQLFSMGIFSSGDFSSIAIAAAAIVEGAANTGTYGYGLNIQNHSWGGSQPFQVIEDAVITAWRSHCILVASRGNRGHLDNAINYPACYSDIMILNTGASGVNGEYKNTSNGDNWWASSFGNNVDFIAPGTTEIVASPINPISPYNYPNNCTSSLYPEYQCFNGTSAAAPHVAGVAALMYSKHHVNNGAPNNLATEDIEYILEKNATDKGAAGYDSFNGWGLINAHASLEKVNYPSYYVKHAPSSTPTQTTAANQNVIIANNTDGIAAGQYIADRIQLNWTYVDVLPTQHEIIDWWTLEAKTYRGVGANVPITGVRHMSVTPNVTIGGNAAVFSVQTFAWWVKTAVGSGQTINKWIPAGGPSQLRYSYSLHVKDNSITSIDENTLEMDVNLFPNPVSDIINLTMNFENASDAQLEIFDAQGKIIANPSLGHKAQGEHTFSINVSNLSNGLYLLKVTSGQSTITKRFIKQ